MNGFLDYVPGGTQIHRLNPLTKLAASFGLCVSCFLAQEHIMVLAIIAFNIAMAAAAGMARRALRTVLSLAKLSAALFALQVLFVRQGRVLLALPLGLGITDLGLRFSLLFATRLIAATMPLALMFSVTQIGDLSNVLVRRLRMPYKYAFALTTAIRFIPLFADEMALIMEAQTARGVQFDTRSLPRKIRLLLPLCVPLLISSVRKIDGCAISAELRGFNLRGRGSGYKEYRFHARDAAALAICAALIAASALA
jgi:energy-coupling factor transport system permease protein